MFKLYTHGENLRFFFASNILLSGGLLDDWGNILVLRLMYN